MSSITEAKSRDELYKLFCSVDLPESFPEKPSTDSVRILQYNVNLFKDFYGKPNLDRVKDVLKEANADIVLLNECMFSARGPVTKPRFLHLAKEELDYPYVTMCHELYGINVVLSKFPFESSPSFQLGKDPIKRINRHFQHISLKPHHGFGVVFTHLDAFDNTEQTRLKQISQILSYAEEHDKSKMLIIGDLNSVNRDDYSTSEWVDNVFHPDRARGVITPTLVTETLRHSGWKDQAKGNISCWTNRKVDFAYMHESNTSVQVLQSQFIKNLSSDHFPLILDIVSQFPQK